MPTYYTPQEQVDWHCHVPDREHEFATDAEAREALIRWGAEDVYRVANDMTQTKIYVVKNGEPISPTAYRTRIFELPYPEIK